MIPLGLVNAPVARPAVITFALTALSILLSLGLWLAPDTRLNEQMDLLRGYGRAHPTQQAPTDCSVAMGNGPWVTQGRAETSAEYERLCIHARELQQRSGSHRVALGQRENDVADWLLHPLVFANPVAALLGWLLLGLVVGPFLEDRWGRAFFGGSVALSALIPALVWSWASNDGSSPWTGAQGWLSALVAAFTVQFFPKTVQFLVPQLPPRNVQLPAFAVAVWWLVARVLGLWWGGADRASVIAEMAGVVAGAGLGVAGLAGWPERMRDLAGGAALRQMQDDLSRRLQKTETTDAAPPPQERSSAPSVLLEPRHVRQPIDPDDLGPLWEVEDPVDLDLEAAGVTLSEAGAPLAGDPGALGWLLGDRDGPERGSRSAAGLDTAAFQAVLAQESPNAEPTGTGQGPPTAVKTPELRGANEAEPNSQRPTSDVFARPGLPLGLAGIEAVVATGAPPAAQPAAYASLKSQIFGRGFGPKAAAEGQDHLRDQSPAPGLGPQDGSRDTLVVPPGSLALGPLALPPGEAERTLAYVKSAAVRTAVNAAAARGVLTPAVRLASDLRRGDTGSLQVQIEEDWENLHPDLLCAVAVGVVEHRNWPEALPEIWLDCVLDSGSRDQPPDVVRLHPSGECLQRLLPGLGKAEAFKVLATELASAGAQRLPIQAQWPGPPWPKYETAADFLKMWQRELARGPRSPSGR